MSASSKKKLRKEQNVASMTEKQAAAKKEAKKLKIYTATFWVVLALCVSIVAGVALRTPIQVVSNRLTTAVVVGDHKVSAVEMNYFYIDAINEYCNQYSQYISYILDMTKPLSQQMYDAQTKTSWADFFVDYTTGRLKNTYALYDAAVKAGHKLTEEEQKTVDTTYDNMDTYATYYGYKNANDYLEAVYGAGASEKSYKEYYDITVLANSYYSAYSKDLKDSYKPVELRDFEKDEPYNYNSYTYAYHYLNVDDFKTGGTEGEDGKITYSDAEIKAAEEALKKAAEELAVADNNTVEKLNAAIEALEKAMAEAEKKEEEENKKDEAAKPETDKDEADKDETAKPETDKDEADKDETAKPETDKDETAKPETDKDEEEEEEEEYSTCVENEDVLYSSITSVMQEWIRDTARKEGDIKAIPYTTKSTDKDGKETETLKGYYVVLFNSSNDNNYALKNVRHILISFEGGTTDSNGQTTYTAAEKEAAKKEANEIYEQWLYGPDGATEENFAALAEKHSTDPGSNTNGGLYEDVYPGQMVESFNDWCFNRYRKPGDSDIVETTYGYHIMYFSGDSETLYRDYMITNDMLEEDMEAWSKALNDAMPMEVKNTKRVNKDLVLNKNSSAY